MRVPVHVEVGDLAASAQKRADERVKISFKNILDPFQLMNEWKIDAQNLTKIIIFCLKKMKTCISKGHLNHFLKPGNTQRICKFE